MSVCVSLSEIWTLYRHQGRPYILKRHIGAIILTPFWVMHSILGLFWSHSWNLVKVMKSFNAYLHMSLVCKFSFYPKSTIFIIRKDALSVDFFMETIRVGGNARLATFQLDGYTLCQRILLPQQKDTSSCSLCWTLTSKFVIKRWNLVIGQNKFWWECLPLCTILLKSTTKNWIIWWSLLPISDYKCDTRQ